MGLPLTRPPAYPLELVKTLIADQRYRITLTAANDAGRLGFDEEDIVSCVNTLGPEDFFNAMPSDKKPGLWQDVYHKQYCGQLLYVKLQVSEGSDGSKAVVISFKQK